MFATGEVNSAKVLITEGGVEEICDGQAEENAVGFEVGSGSYQVAFQ